MKLTAIKSDVRFKVLPIIPLPVGVACFLFIFLLDRGGEAIGWILGSCPASSIVVVVYWIKLASSVMKGVDIDGYTHLVWPWSLGIA